jgi:indoleamine 2,3-dioxygenase
MSNNIDPLSDAPWHEPGPVSDPTDKDIYVWDLVLNNSDTKKLAQKYNITKYGYLPEKCLESLPPKFEYLNICADALPETKTSSSEFRDIINSLPKSNFTDINIDDLDLDDAYKLYSILTMVVNRYVWCNGIKDAKNYSIIPPQISIPLYKVSEKLNIVPTLTHAAVDLWNWKITDPSKPFSLDNIDVINTLTGNKSEEWFYKVMIAIEGISGESVMIAQVINKYYDDPETILSLLKVMNTKINAAVSLIKRMYEQCDPDFFFDRLRIYLSGSKNEFLPDGIKFDLTPIDMGYEVYCLIGGSAAQSTLIQMYDILFDVKHDGHGKKFLDEMRFYMPGIHRIYLEDLSLTPSIKLYLTQITDSDRYEDIKNIYNKCVLNLKRFREAHIGLVHAYIMKMVDDRKEAVKVNKDDNIKNAHGEKGSGGTNPVEFCKELIEDTQNTIKPKEIKSLGDTIKQTTEKVSQADNNWITYIIIPLGGLIIMWLFMFYIYMF